jgi:NitT/TauT family transport system permease protein
MSIDAITRSGRPLAPAAPTESDGTPAGVTVARMGPHRRLPAHLMLRRSNYLQVIMTLIITGLWELASHEFDLGFWISSPTEIIVELFRWYRSGELLSDVEVTVTAAGIGFLIGSFAGGLVGFVLGWVRGLGDLFEPFVLAIYTLPKVALAPLFVLWFGIGMLNKIMFAALLVFFMVFFTTFQGTRQVDRDLVENARLLGATGWDTWFKIALPYSSVWIFTGIRIGLPYALIGAIVGEFVAAQAGVGFRIKEATAIFNTAGVFAGLLVLMVISIAFLSILKLIERRALRWQSVGMTQSTLTTESGGATPSRAPS